MGAAQRPQTTAHNARGAPYPRWWAWWCIRAVGAYRYRGPGACRHSRGLASATLALASADVYAAAAVIINAANCANTYNLASGGASRVERIG